MLFDVALALFAQGKTSVEILRILKDAFDLPLRDLVPSVRAAKVAHGGTWG